MYFKSLELIGFKSFAEKTKLNFEPGVTAIVGPNGCGKSNIADGIRWVLGEQSAKSLRAGNMQDVIFNGTDSKEPINFAEVSLIFSNEKRVLPIDYDEVTITRRIYRSGDTEYLLNRTPVRLKDISELLMGTGIGTESYSIIEQGKIDLILSSRPEDRRYVFEEASGITKYKSKKKEALRKLEQTEQNLLRINDIIQEVKRQISSIERQARKAERYKVDFEKMKEMEVGLSSFEYKDIKNLGTTYAVENNDAKARERDLDSEIRSIASNVSGYRQSMDEVNQKISEARAKYQGTSSSVEMSNHKITIDKERIGEALAVQENLKKEMETSAEKIKNARALAEKLKGELEAVREGKSAKQKTVREKEMLLGSLAKDIDETESRVKTLKVRIVDHLAKETHIKNELIKMGADLQNRRARQRRLGIEKDTVARELESLENALAEVLKEFKDIEGRASALKAGLESKKALNDALLSEIKGLEENIAKDENALTAVKSKIEILDDSLRRYEGFSRGVKGLLAGRPGKGGLSVKLVGILADMIEVKKGYEEAVDTFLGDDAEIVITENDSDIEKAVDYIKTNRLGKATFISMESLKRMGPKGQNNPPENGLTPLKGFVSIDPRYEPVLDYFFANAYLASSGLVFSDGKVSGGASSDSDESLLIGRKSRIEDLRAQSARLEKGLASLGSALAKKRDINNTLASEISSLEEVIHAEEINLSNIRIKKDSKEEEAKKIKDEFELLDSELEEANQAIEELTKKGSALNAELNAIEKEKEASQNFIDEGTLAVSNKRSERERISLDLATLKAETQSLEKEEDNALKNLKGQEAALFELEDTLYSKEGLLKDSSEKAKALEDEIEKLYAENDRASVELNALGDEIASLEKSKSDVADKLGIAEIQLKENEKKIESLRNQIRDLDVKSAELNYKKTNLKERILQAYKVDLESAHIELEQNIDREALKVQVAELKERLDKMGPVNLVAIDEHRELEERYAFLVHQQEDLIAAKESLHKAILKINKTTKELFIDTFQKIHAEFKNFFKLLFGGGQAELVLIDEQDILESGIEIIVRPPGKKLQNIMLLSGGEKALTAIALLFAIFKVKPSPFCVLDEIDAPLDESNINRFSSVLKDFLKISQFIIITHNKRTIELAEVMYGITMQERGVSKIVSVKFSDKAEEKEEKKEFLSPASL